jgi:hypothetical protein
MCHEARIDMAAAHKYVSVECFNRTWTLIEKPVRTERDNHEMMLGAVTSLWHWSQRSDCTRKNLSIGNRQASHANCLIGSDQ